ncbi:MAG: hypothetical protein C5B59_16940 [Bacteroidetes bacterium]|nr:MAG: hypothetical protein C5B59_16940 [Bacteroidota bacterium]
MSKRAIVFILLSLASGIYGFQSDSLLPRLIFFASILCLYISLLGRKRSTTSKRMYVAPNGQLLFKWFHEEEPKQENSRESRRYLDHLYLD